MIRFHFLYKWILIDIPQNILARPTLKNITLIPVKSESIRWPFLRENSLVNNG